ncbi:MAG: KH domain-containing protein [Spirochaetales bacterium]|nr:KH domain-containing protein [Leptospiraceae bacterium]MCP5483797.1 KH domain-containing protein [Spirochaetales bacterium]
MAPVELVEYVVSCLVSQPDDVDVRTIPGNEETVIEVRVAEDDIGKVIGKNGSVARALRTLVSALGVQDNTSYILEIID